MTFDWMIPRARRDRSGEDERRRQMYRAEIADRAALLRRLGYSTARTEARLRANLAWDFEVGAERPNELGDRDVGKLVKAAFAR